ncbi:LysR substrate-binding domain-containing protein [Acidimangrovimonas sediminis]|uniref:LysR substrate-binding domain-containing protein n=1 Tax=Acidimangrovimonas sediminis TaxID=2056283 RepID=UPI000C7F8228|nr:LysR substrate-binding domain-containing protein [Acidimangrovimonas sediminis]
MRRGRLPLTALRAFEAAGRLESVTRAAEELAVSQAAVSRQIRALEEDLGTRLFERLHRGLRLTEAGGRLQSALSTAFDGIDEALAEVATNRHEVLTVSADPSFAACLLAPSLALFQSRAPEADVVLNSDARIVDLATEGVTFAIRYAKDRDHWPRTEAKWLCNSRLTAYLSPALAGRLILDRPEALLPLPRLHEDSRDHWQSWFAAAGVQVAPDARGMLFNDSAVLLQAAIAGQGVALLDETFAEAAVARGDLIRPFATAIPAGAYWLVARSFARLSPGARDFAAWLQEVLRPGIISESFVKP